MIAIKNTLGCLMLMVLALLSGACLEPAPGDLQVDFDADIVSGDAPLTVEFTDLSDPGDSQITAWFWDFGDGGDSEEQDPSHTYETPGTYDVSLTVTTGDEFDTETKLEYITVTGGEQTILLPGDVPLVMTWIPGGTFMMGRSPEEQDSNVSEDPRHEASVSGFWMAKYELTQEQWQAVMETTPWSAQIYVLNDLDSPAVYVSWNDAKAFITALNTYTGLTFRLPSEAEWEYACRADTTTRFYWGDDLSYTDGDAYCWWKFNAWDVNERYAHVAGQKLPNTFGLYDMSGNVWEWCEDDWHTSYTSAPTDGSAWVEDPRGAGRVIRGGAWDGNGIQCRSARRNNGSPTDAHSSIGFRLVR